MMMSLAAMLSAQDHFQTLWSDCAKDLASSRQPFVRRFLLESVAQFDLVTAVNETSNGRLFRRWSQAWYWLQKSIYLLWTAGSRVGRASLEKSALFSCLSLIRLLCLFLYSYSIMIPLVKWFVFSHVFHYWWFTQSYSIQSSCFSHMLCWSAEYIVVDHFI